MRAFVLMAAVCFSGCFYTEVINVAPMARIDRLGAGGPVNFNDEVMFTAENSADEDGDDLTYAWAARECTGCQAFASFDAGSKFNFRVPLSHQLIRIELEVRDVHGATSTALFVFDVANRNPGVQLQVQTSPNPTGSYTPSKPVRFAATGSDPDLDPITYSWKVYPPPLSDPGASHLEVIQNQVVEVTPDVAGVWEVEVTVKDNYGGIGTARRSFTVAEDEPPCIEATSPAWSPDTRIVLLRSSGARRFSIASVTDDVEVFPGPNIHFRWLVSAPGSSTPLEVVGHDLADLEIDPAELDAGDVLGVRVEITDRKTRTLPCSVDQAACSFGGNACVQRLTWTVEVR